ncbi:PAS domain S-box protein [Planctomicrobium piriforme]|uniref:PAS domain S-box protein n=1 Tax=Planctomicrobium piriforme TaxID=1576369 RepID=UPI001587D348|nr:PAS domain S-box protein [Planctomicrobium piriforme]
MILESMGEAAFVTCPDGEIRFMNHAAELLSGWNSGESLGRSAPEVFLLRASGPGTAPLNTLQWEELSQLGAKGECEARLSRRDGCELPVRFSSRELFDEKGNAKGFLFLSRDITPLKQVEATVSESRERLVAALRAARMCAWDWDPQSDEIHVSGTAEEVFGLPPGMSLERGSSGLKLIHPEDAERHREAVQNAAAQCASWHTQFRVIRPRDGEVSWLEERAVARRDPATGLVLITGLVWEITERKRADVERARLAETLGLAVDAADLGTWEWDPATDLMNLSTRAAQMYGVEERSQHTRSALRERLHPDDRDRARAAALHAVETRRDYEIEYRLVPERDQEIWISARGRGVYDEGGQLLRMHGIVQDISARKAAELALRASEERHRFLTQLSEATQPLTDPSAIMHVTARLLAEHLGVDRCAYAEVEQEAEFVITGDFPIDVPSIVGRWPVAAFGAECQRAMRANTAFIVHNVLTDSRLEPSSLPAYAATNTAAVICVPLHKAGAFTAAMAVHQTRPRLWTPVEILLVTSVVNRCWETLERARTHQAEQNWHAQVLTERGQLEEVFRLAPSFMAVLRGPEHVFERVNNRYCELVGRRELIGRPVREAIPEVSGQGFFELLDRVYKTGEPFLSPETRVWLRTASGMELEERMLEFVYQPLAGIRGEITGILVQGIDLTERRRAESSLVRITAEAERRRRLYETALSNTPDLVYVFDLDYRFTYANEALLAMWGRTWEEAIGKTCLELGYAPWHAEMHQREIDQVRATRRPIRGEVPFQGTQGRRVYDYIFVPVIGADGAVEAVAGTTRDITERQALEESLRTADRKKDEFIALLAHELRNPLAPIRTGLDLLRISLEDRALAEEVVATMEGQTEHLVRLVDDLLDISRITRGKVVLRKEPFLLSQVVQRAVDAVQALFTEAGHRLHVTLPETPVVIDADPVRITQVISNLLSNAARYTPPGGRIDLVCQIAEGELVVTVRDNGIGIPAPMLESIFELFTQVDRSVERSQGGLGIGLTLVRRLVELHGGTVSATSPGPGCGSDFVMRLPAGLARASEDAPVPARTATENSPLRVLVVDDNTDAARMLALMIERSGHLVQTAGDGEAAVHTAEAFRPHLILMDLGMPKMDGFEATAQIRRQTWGGEILIVALTGWGQEDDKRRTAASGFDQHFVKPMDLTALRKLFSQCQEATRKRLTSVGGQGTSAR